MGSFDVISSYHVIPAAGGGAGDADVVEISGRVRLFHVWLTGKTSAVRTVIFKNGSSTADTLLKFDFNFTNWPTPDNNNPIPGGGILFDGGMYFDPQNLSGSVQIQTATFIYQLGG